jgi:histidine triad (HIT) family protein
VSADPSCVFCRIVAGTIPSHRLCEDARSFAFLDINPANRGHALVIPKAHSPDLVASDDADLAAVMATVRRVAAAIEKVVKPDGFNLLQANGPGAAQSVMHFHMHIVPRKSNDGLMMNWPLVPGDQKELAALAAEIRAVL